MRVPTHLGIIMDGTGEWARDRGLDRATGHLEALKAAWRITGAAGTAGVKFLSLYVSEEGAVFQTPVVRRILDRIAARVKARTGMTVKMLVETGGRDNRPWAKGTPDLDLLVRTGGSKKVSNVLLGRSESPEMVFSPKPWPEFGIEDLKNALKGFAARGRCLKNLAGLLPLPSGRVLLN